MPTSVYHFLRQWCAVEEVNRGETPLNSANWFNIGATKLTPGIALEHQQIRMPGSRETYADIIGRRTDTFNITYYPYDTKMIRFGTYFGGPGTNEKSISILQAYKIGTETVYDLYQGCVTTSHTFNIPENGIYNCSQTFQNSTSYKKLTQAEVDAIIGTTGAGLVLPGPMTARPFTNLDGPEAPFTLDTELVKFKEGSLNTSWELLEARPQGNRQPTDLDVGAVNREFNFTTWAETIPDMIGTLEGFAPVDLEYILWLGTPDCIMSMPGFLANSYDTDFDTEAGAFVEESMTGTLEGFEITTI